MKPGTPYFSVQPGKFRYLVCALLAFLLSISSAFSQTEDERLAKQFLENKEYEKAADLYEKVYSKKPDNTVYKNLLECYKGSGDIKSAEKLIHKQAKRNPRDSRYGVELGQLFEKSGEPDKARKEYAKAIDKVNPQVEDINDLALAFLGIGKPDLALTTYDKGRRIFAGYYGFQIERSEVYRQLKMYDDMIRELSSYLETNPQTLTEIQNYLQNHLVDDPDGKIAESAKRVFLKKVQNNPEDVAQTEMLIWILIQQKDFYTAFNQLKAIDKKQKGDGGRLMQLAKISAANREFDLAVQCYEYVISKGNLNYYYVQARIELVNLLFDKITSTSFTVADLDQIERSYREALKELGTSPSTVPLQKGLAHVLGFFRGRTEEAISLLETANELPGVTEMQRAEIKLELGDLYLFSGDMWESSLLYSQVEKAFKNDAIGQEAKFRNARLSFYKGDFGWAQAQLDVLKSATSKLIANDALYFSLLIIDNTGEDSITDPLLIYSRADLLSFQNHDSLALITLDSIGKNYPGHSLSDEVLFKKYRIFFRQGKFEKAKAALKEIDENYATDILADDALYQLGIMEETIFKDTEKAKKIYEDLLTRFPGSTYAVDARKRFRALRGDTIN